MTPLEETARATVRRHDLFADGDAVVALVSGGADSVAMLRLLASGTLGDVVLRVVHVNHLLRGDASDADARFVDELCEALAVECVSVAVDVGAWADAERLNLEDAGRQTRYRLAEAERGALLASGVRQAVVATAHTLDDRIETFFMRALTGSGSGALSSIRYRRGNVVRPLLDAERSTVRAYLECIGQAWREDATNADTTRLRSAVRHTLLPASEDVAPAFRQTMRRTLGILAEEDALLEELASEARAGVLDDSDARVIAFDVGGLRALPRPLARRVLRAALTARFAEAGRLDSEHLDAVLGGAARKGFARDLPQGLRAVREYDRLVISRAAETTPGVAPSLLSVPGRIDLGECGFLAADEADPVDLSGSSHSVVIDAAGIDVLTVGEASDGERMRPLGMSGSRKLSDLLTEAKVPRRLRASVPVVRHGERVVWLAGVRMSDEYRVTETTRTAVRLTWNGDMPRREAT